MDQTQTPPHINKNTEPPQKVMVMVDKKGNKSLEFSGPLDMPTPGAEAETEKESDF